MSDKYAYFDHSATTPVDPLVMAAMEPYFSIEFGNPSSVHRLGQRAEGAVSSARSSAAELLGCAPSEVVFTASGTESDNLALRGAASASRERLPGGRILISDVEHEAVRKTALDLAEQYGFSLDLLAVDKFGRVDPDQLARAIRPDTVLVSIMYANNEIGSINPIPELANVCREHGVHFHTDAVQAALHLDLDVSQLGVDLLSLSAHKFYGPKGVGILYIREGVPFRPPITGGAQERGRRPGTLNPPLIIGAAEALALVRDRRRAETARVMKLRDQLIAGVLSSVRGAALTGHPGERLANHASFTFDDIDSNNLLAALDLAGFGCSSGSACKTGDPEPSHVLGAIGLSDELALGSLRVTLGSSNNASQVDRFLNTLPAAVERLRSAQAITE